MFLTYLYFSYDKNIVSNKNKVAVYFFDFNECVLNTNLNGNDLKIYWSNSDYAQQKYCIYEKNRFIKNIKTSYGTYVFDVFYKNKPLGKLYSDNFCSWETSIYTFDIQKNNNVIISTLTCNNPRQQRPETDTIRYLWQ